MKAATHDGTFHADDVFAHAVLRAALGDVELVRTRDPARIAEAEIVFDVGAVYDPAARRYDHHMRERPLRSDGIPYSSVGLIWRDFGIAALPALLGRPALDQELGRQVWQDVDAEWIVHIDKADNGVSEPGPGHLSALIEAMNPVWDASTSPDQAFLEASELAFGILARACQHAEASVRAAKIVVKAARSGADPRIVVLDQKLPWEKAVFAGGLSEALFVLYPSEDGASWYVRTVPPEPDSFGQRLPLPEAWRGLNDKAFSAASGVPDATFCHPSRFICGARSRESAIELARRAIALAEGSPPSA
jgi:uncharacterized UPF0160 family protein